MNDVYGWRVPGRVNLLGEHLDYNGGMVLPIAINQHLIVKARPRTDGMVRVWSAGRTAVCELAEPQPPAAEWHSYAVAAVRAAIRYGLPCTGLDIVVEASLPAGAGLSSSAALICGVVLTMADAYLHRLAPLEVAQIAQSAENHELGTPVGLMDQLAVLSATEGHAMAIDFAAKSPAVAHLPSVWGEDGLTLAVIDTGVRHQLATSHYTTRQTECADIAQLVGLENLAHLRLDQLVALTDPLLAARGRHVLTESARVARAPQMLATRRWKEFGAMLTASHESLRDDFAVSSPELDLTVQVALDAGALGAKLTGGGFGGSAIALLANDRLGHLEQLLVQRYDELGWPSPTVYPVTAQGGATRIG